MCASGRVRDSKSDSHEDGMGECGCVGKWSWRVEMPRPIVQIPKGHCQPGRADGMSCKEMSADGQGESGKLIPTMVELDDPGGGEKPRVCLGGTKTRIGKVESHGCRADESRGQANESRGQADASMVLNTGETVATGNGGGTGARSDPGPGARHDRAGPDSHANQSGVSSGHVDMPDIRNGMNMTADATESISTRQNIPQMQNLPIDARRHDQAKPRSHAGMPNMRVDTHGIAIHANMAGDTQKRVSTHTEGMKLPDLPTGCTKPR